MNRADRARPSRPAASRGAPGAWEPIRGRARRAPWNDRLDLLAAGDAARRARGHSQARRTARSREARALSDGVLAREARGPRARCVVALRAGGTRTPGDPR